MNYYVILSEGAYSDYSPQYFVGEREITKEELDARGAIVGDAVILEWENAPIRAHIHRNKYCCTWQFSPKILEEKYNPETGEAYGSYPTAQRWLELMSMWLVNEGYQRLPEEIPEINTSYSDFPSTIVRKSAFD